MNKMLEKLAEGYFCLEPCEEKRSKEQKEACNAAYTMLEKLSAGLKGEESEMLNKAVEAIGSENYYCTKEKFIEGYCLGALLMLETLESRKDFFADGI